MRKLKALSHRNVFMCEKLIISYFAAKLCIVVYQHQQFIERMPLFSTVVKTEEKKKWHEFSFLQ